MILLTARDQRVFLELPNVQKLYGINITRSFGLRIPNVEGRDGSLDKSDQLCNFHDDHLNPINIMLSM